MNVNVEEASRLLSCCGVHVGSLAINSKLSRAYRFVNCRYAPLAHASSTASKSGRCLQYDARIRCLKRSHLRQVPQSVQALNVVYQDFEELNLNIPYRSGYLGFREVPAYSTLLSRLKARCEGAEASPHPAVPAAANSNSCTQTAPGIATCSHTGAPVWPQVALVDGFGVLHHRRCGSASHLGVQCNIPTVGVGKTLLQRDGLNERHVRETIGNALQAITESNVLPPGCYTKQTNRGETVACMELIGENCGDVLGVAVAGMHGTQRPIYISRGHMVSLQTAVDITLACCEFRIPEPIRQADLSSRECVRKLLQRQKEATE